MLTFSVEQLALTEAAYVTTRLVQTISRIEAENLEPWRESLTLSCCSADGTKVRVWLDGREP